MRLTLDQTRALKWAFFFSAYLMLAINDLYTAVAILFLHIGLSLSTKIEFVLQMAGLLMKIGVWPKDENDEEPK